MPRLVAVSAELLDPAHPLHPASTGEQACKGFAWIDLVGRARPFNSGGLQRGQLRASVRFLSTRWNWSSKRTYTFLVNLENENRIRWERPPVGKRVGGVITICKYDTYQPQPIDDRNTNDNTNYHKGMLPVVSITPSVVPNGPTSVVKLTTGREVEQTSFVEPVQRVYTPNDIASMMIFRWIEQVVPQKPPESQIKKQFRIAVLMANENEPNQIAQAWEGMAHTWPFSEGRLWDMFDLRKHFGKAFQNATTELNEDVRWEAFFGKEEP